MADVTTTADDSSSTTTADDSSSTTTADDSSSTTTADDSSSTTTADLSATSAFLLAFGANLQALSLFPSSDHKAVVSAAVGAFVSTL